jgi:hypothetical protein
MPAMSLSMHSAKVWDYELHSATSDTHKLPFQAHTETCA